MPTPNNRGARTGPAGRRTERGQRRQRAQARDPLTEAVTAVGDRWSLLVVNALLPGAKRFKELIEAIDGLAPNVLSNRLKQLEANRIVIAEPYSQRPLRHAYRLTASGNELAGVLRLLAQWAAHQPQGVDADDVATDTGAAAPATLTHHACGTPLEARWYCPTCGEVTDEPGDDGHPTDLLWV